MRFLVDMGIALDVAAALRARGHDVSHLSDVGLPRISDDRILAKALSEKRIIVTHDLDFGRLMALTKAPEPSLITFRIANMTPPSVIGRLDQLLTNYETDLEQGAAISVTDGATRCHRLPIGNSDESSGAD